MSRDFLAACIALAATAIIIGPGELVAFGGGWPVRPYDTKKYRRNRQTPESRAT